MAFEMRNFDLFDSKNKIEKKTTFAFFYVLAY